MQECFLKYVEDSIKKKLGLTLPYRLQGSYLLLQRRSTQD